MNCAVTWYNIYKSLKKKRKEKKKRADNFEYNMDEILPLQGDILPWNEIVKINEAILSI